MLLWVFSTYGKFFFYKRIEIPTKDTHFTNMSKISSTKVFNLVFSLCVRFFLHISYIRSRNIFFSFLHSHHRDFFFGLLFLFWILVVSNNNERPTIPKNTWNFVKFGALVEAENHFFGTFHISFNPNAIIQRKSIVTNYIKNAFENTKYLLSPNITHIA